MNVWEDRLYRFPDDGCATHDRLLQRLPEEHAINMVSFIEGFVLIGLSSSDEVILHLVMGGIETREGGSPLVPLDRRESVEEVLPMLGQSAVGWLEVHRISGEPGALRAFEALWKRHVLGIIPLPPLPLAPIASLARRLNR